MEHGGFELHIQSACAFRVILKRSHFSKTPVRQCAATAAVFVVSEYDKWFQPDFDFTTLSIWWHRHTDSEHRVPPCTSAPATPVEMWLTPACKCQDDWNCVESAKTSGTNRKLCGLTFKIKHNKTGTIEHPPRFNLLNDADAIFRQN